MAAADTTEKRDDIKQEPLTGPLAEVEDVLKPVQGRDYSGAYEKTDPREIALVRKLDWYILPLLWTMYWLNYLDRNAIALARLNTLEKDLGLVGSQYQTCVSILFVGYVIVGIPANMVVTRVRPSLWMSACMAVWAIISLLTAFSRNYIGLLMTRFTLGITEAPYYPGALYILATFYTRKELATRISILYTGNILATAFAGLIALGIFKMHGMAGLAGWQWLFILQGAVTLVVAIGAVFILPDEPLTTRWLTEEERLLAHERTQRDTVANAGQTTTWSGIYEAAKDPKVWLFVFMQHCHLGELPASHTSETPQLPLYFTNSMMNLCANGFKNFFPTAVKTLGFDQTITLVLTCPPYLIAGIISIAWSWSSGRFNERTWHITIAKAVAVFGFVLGCATLNTGARYCGFPYTLTCRSQLADELVAMIVFSIGTYAVNSIILGWVSNTCSQTREKKACSLAIVNCIAVSSFIWTPYMWPTSDEPRYVMALSSSAALSIATAAGAWGMRFWLKNENKKIRRSEDETTVFYAY